MYICFMSSGNDLIGKIEKINVLFYGGCWRWIVIPESK